MTKRRKAEQILVSISISHSVESDLTVWERELDLDFGLLMCGVGKKMSRCLVGRCECLLLLLWLYDETSGGPLQGHQLCDNTIPFSVLSLLARAFHDSYAGAIFSVLHYL